MLFKMPDFRTGDVVKITRYQSLSEKNELEYQGLVYSTKATGSIRCALKVNFNVESTNVRFGTPLYSPLVKDFEILKYGSNMLRAKLNYIP